MDAVGMTTPRRVRDEEQKERPDFTYGWPMAIGSVEVPLLEMVQMYGVIANHGVFEPLTYFCGLADQHGAITTPFFDIPPSQVIEEQAADGVDSILRDPESKPEGFWRKILTIPGVDVAAKTGTSNLCLERDVYGRCVRYGVNNVWTMGYGPKLVVGVWVGNADASAMDDLADGLTVAAPIWHKFLERAESAYQGGEVCTEDLTKLEKNIE